MTCKRPDWSDAASDYCSCDDPNFEPALEAGENPCEECSWWMEEDE